MTEQLYGDKFFKDHEPGSGRSANVIVPIVMDLLGPTSVVDVGCGQGSWLAVFKDHGVRRILGVDGYWVDRSSLKIPPDRFLACDLSKPFQLDERFGLVVSLEVAEHLPAECADVFVESLSSLGPAILFSAAVPSQGGTGHINEQWPEYWVRRFTARDYTAIDCVRKYVWTDNRVELSYAQNTLLFARDEIISSSVHLQEALRCSGPMSIVHPKLLEAVTRRKEPSVGQLLRDAPRAFSNTVRHRIARYSTRRSR